MFVIVGWFLLKYVEKLLPKLRWHYSASWGTGQIQIWWVEVPRTLIFMICGFIEPLGTLLSEFEYTKLLCKKKEIGTHFWNILSYKSQIIENQRMICWPRFGKDGHRQIMKIRPTNYRKSWRWDQYLLENMEFKFGHTNNKKNEGSFNILKFLNFHFLNSESSKLSRLFFWNLAT